MKEAKTIKALTIANKNINKKLNVYIILFILVSLYNSISFTVGNHIAQGIFTLIFSFVVIYFSEKEKVWAIVVVRIMVWLHILMALLFLGMFIKTIL